MSKPLSITFGCSFDLRSFPFDTQQCPIVFEVYGYSADEAVLVWNLDDPEWPEIQFDKQLRYRKNILKIDYLLLSFSIIINIYILLQIVRYNNQE